MYPLGKMRRAFPNRKIRNLSLFHENPHSKTTKPIAHFGFGFDVFLQHHMWVQIIIIVNNISFYLVLYVCKELSYSQAILENQGHLNEIHLDHVEVT